MAVRLSGKRALITGGDQGIGRGIAVRFAEEGADVVISYRTHQDNADDTVGRLRELGRQAHALQNDVSNVDALKNFLDDAEALLAGQIDILVNNAGIERRAEFLQATEEDYDLVLGVNLKGPFFLSQIFARSLVEAKRRGKIINISSVHEELPFPNFASYCAAKGGLKMLCRDLAIELAPHGITVNNIAPGAIKTPINAELLHDPEKLDPLLANIPLRRLGTPEDVAACAAFLASSDADYITGTTLVTDGGLLYNYHEQ
jgi:glucose 1-dehydrogenase